MNTYFIETYGCQMNVAESSYLKLQLDQEGWIEAADPEYADLVVLQTCSVRKTAENRIAGRIGHYTAEKKNRDLTLVVTGCMAERLGEELKTMHPAVDRVVGNFDKIDLAELLKGKTETTGRTRGFRFPATYGFTGEFQAYLPIMHGCNNFCSYCIVPYVRGREISRKPEQVLYEVKLLVENGVGEITLLGQNVNSYKESYKGKEMTFPALLELIVQTAETPWIRFLTSHPKDFSEELIDIIAAYDPICNQIHLPVQHGSNRVLKAMNRKYNRESFMKLVDSIRSKIPDVSLTTDILIGFPGEREQDFRDTVDLLETVRFDDAFTYKFNIREGTPAAEFPEQLDEKTKGKRLEEIIAIQRNISNNRKAERTGMIEEILVKQLSKKNSDELLGISGRGDSVVFPGAEGLIGSFQQVRLTGLLGSTFKGELI